MIKKIFTLAIATGLFMGMPLAANANESIEIVEQTLQTVDNSVSSNVQTATGRSG